MIEQLGNVLIVDDSVVSRETMAMTLRPHSDDIKLADGCETALVELDAAQNFNLSLCDLVLDDGDGLEILEHLLGNHRQPHPHVIFVGSRWRPSTRRRAEELGAIGCIDKPVSFREIAEIWDTRLGHPFKLRYRVRATYAGEAILQDPKARDTDIVRWPILDLSPSGAFLQPPDPIPVGATFSLRLILAEFEILVQAVVVRTQHPSWSATAGVSVRFSEVSESDQALLRRLANVPG